MERNEQRRGGSDNGRSHYLSRVNRFGQQNEPLTKAS